MSSTRLTAAASLACAALAHAQTPTLTYQITFRGLPSGSPGVLMFNDHAQIVVNATISPPVGSQVTYTPPPGPGVGTVAGLGFVSFDILACDAIPGTWTLSGPGFQGTTGTTWGLRAPWNIGSAGTTQSVGDVVNISAGQFPFPTANPTNPVNEIWRGRWDYSTFWSGRRMRLTLYPRDAAVLVQYGTSGGMPLYVQVPVAASPVSTDIFLDTGAPPPCFPFVEANPQSTTVYSGAPATFFTVGIWYNPTPTCGEHTYHWRRNCEPLVDGGRISGASTSTLRIDPVLPGDAGQYDALVSGTHSAAAALTVLCYANCDASTIPPILNVNDFTCFLNKFAAGDTYANCDHSTSAPILNVLDFGCFLNLFAAGCG